MHRDKLASKAQGVATTSEVISRTKFISAVNPVLPKSGLPVGFHPPPLLIVSQF